MLPESPCAPAGPGVDRCQIRRSRGDCCASSPPCGDPVAAPSRRATTTWIGAGKQSTNRLVNKTVPSAVYVVGRSTAASAECHPHLAITRQKLDEGLSTFSPVVRIASQGRSERVEHGGSLHRRARGSSRWHRAWRTRAPRLALVLGRRRDPETVRTTRGSTRCL